MTSAIEPVTQSVTQVSAVDVMLDLDRYLEIQSAFDKRMPEAIIEIARKKYRTKVYWRFIGTALKVRCEYVKDEPFVTDDGDHGWIAIYRASQGDRQADGDGACFESEKAGSQGTVHNVRSHAHTRAYNRAISNLVGFGEVSAEEMQQTRGAAQVVEAIRTGKESAPTASQFDKPLGFGKHKDKTWRYMTQGQVGGERFSYLEWLEGSIKEKLAKDPTSQYAKADGERLERVQACLKLISDRADREAAAIDAEQSEIGNADEVF